MGDTEELIAFCKVRLAEEEARSAALLEAARQAIDALKEPRLLGREIPGWHSWPDVEAMCSRVMQDVEAGRRIVADCERYTSGQREFNPAHVPYGTPYRSPAANLAYRTLRSLAAGHDAHPEYKPQWKPEG